MVYKRFLQFWKACFSLIMAAAVAFSSTGSVFAQIVRPSDGAPAGSVYSNPGPYSAGWRRVTVTRPNATTFRALLFYPAAYAGENAAYQGGGAPYPALAFGHGYLVYPSRYQSTLEHLATWGYFVIATESGMEIISDDQAYADDLSISLTYLEDQSRAAGSWLFGQVNLQRMGMSGHSMGAGASLLAAAEDGRVKAVANLAAAETNPSSIDLMAELYIPVSLISGSEDSFTPLETNSQLFYDAGGSPRHLPVIQGGSHCGFMDQYIIGCDTGTLDRASQLRLSRHLLVSFFNLYLKGEQAAWRQVWGPEASADPLVVLQSDPGIALQVPAVQQNGWPGSSAVYWLSVVNTGRQASAYTLLQEGSTWPVNFYPQITPLLEPGQSALVQVIVSIPIIGAFQSDQALLSARSNLDGATRHYLQITTAGLPYLSLLPFVLHLPGN
jgi:dienelactone hydrolase